MYCSSLFIGIRYLQNEFLRLLERIAADRPDFHCQSLPDIRAERACTFEILGPSVETGGHRARERESGDNYNVRALRYRADGQAFHLPSSPPPRCTRSVRPGRVDSAFLLLPDSPFSPLTLTPEPGNHPQSVFQSVPVAI